MKCPFLFIAIGTLTASLLGCNSEPPPVSSTPVQPAANTGSTTSPKPKLNSRARKETDYSNLLLVVNKELDADGNRTAISLNEQGMTLAEAAAMDEASTLLGLNAGRMKLTDTEMELLTRFSSLEKLELGINTQITDEGLTHLSGLKELRFLSLAFCPNLTGAGFSNLVDLDNLVILNISNNKNITDENLNYLSELESLQVLQASSMGNLTDDALESLSQISDLRRLSFRSDLITDDGLTHLAKLKHLEVLNLSGCSKLTDDGMEKLQLALPDCRVQR